MTEQQIISLLRNDPENGVAMVMDLYGGPIKVICVNILRDFSNEDIEEAISDTLVAIWKSVNHFDQLRGTCFKSYCYGIARKTALARRREIAGDSSIIPLKEDTLADDVPLENAYDTNQEKKILHETIAELGEPERSIFILRYFYFFRIKEIAAKLNLSDKKVENCLYRGKQRLKTMLLQKGVERE